MTNMTEASYTSGLLQVNSYRILQFHITKVVKNFDINVIQWFILGKIYESQEVTSAEIAELLKVEPPLITNLTDGLVEMKLIAKNPSKNDKRLKILTLTQRGRNHIGRVEKSLQIEIARLLDGLTTKELTTYNKVLRTIVTNS